MGIEHDLLQQSLYNQWKRVSFKARTKHVHLTFQCIMLELKEVTIGWMIEYYKELPHIS